MRATPGSPSVVKSVDTLDRARYAKAQLCQQVGQWVHLHFPPPYIGMGRPWNQKLFC
jgi:hypothetical protein